MAFLAFDDGLGGTTNLLTYSEQFDNAVWTKNTGTTVTANTTVAPDGSLSADTITYDGSGTAGLYRLYNTLAAVPSGQPFTSSIWLRSATPVTLALANNLGSVMCAVTPTWQRFSVTAIGNGASAAQLLIYSPSGVNTAFAIQAWGAQVEYNAQATAYVPTTSATVTNASLQNDYPAPANRFSNWTPTSPPFGDSVNVLADGALVMVKFRNDYGASFDLVGIPVKAQADGVNYVDIADRLITHLSEGGTVSVQTGDAGARIYPSCGLYPGTTPSLRMTDSRNLLYTLSLKLANRAAVRMTAVYAP